MGKRAEPSTTSVASVEAEFNISDDEGSQESVKKPPPHPQSSMRIWVPGSMLHQVHPGLVEDYAMQEEARKTKKTTRKGKAKVDDGDHSDTQSSSSVQVHSRRSQLANPAATDLACQSSRADLDPWFSSGGNNAVGSLSSAAIKSNFLFTFPDPESLSDDKNSPHDDNMLVDEPVQEDDLPPSRFDTLFDQVMGLSKKPSRSSKASNQKKRCKNLGSETLAKLDKLETRDRGRVTKRQKITHEAPVSVGCLSYQPFPMMPALSDSEATSSCSLALRIAKGSASLRRTAFRPSIYPEPSSSQESRLSSQADDFIDLT
jgi:Holliday junction resolvase YEN1